MIERLLGGTALVLALAATPALAQAADAAPPRSAGDAAGNADIIVTANKRAENIQNVPVAVTPLSQAQLASRNIVSIAEITTIAPSLSFVEAPSPSTTMFVIRGVGTFAFNDALEQSVGLVVDGLPMARLVGSISDAVDMGQVQLLRGPQGTLFGKNATAGLISLDTKDPVYRTGFDGRVYVGSYAEHRAQATINLPISDGHAALRVSGWHFTRNGFLKAPFQPDGNQGSIDHTGGRAKLLLEPSDGWRIVLTGEVRHDWDDGPTRTLRGIILNQNSAAAVNPATGTGFNQPVSDLERTVYAFNQAYGLQPGPGNLTTMVNYPESTLAKQGRVSAKSTWHLGDGDLTAIAGYVHTHTDARQDSDYTNSSLTMAIPAGSFTYNGVTNPFALRFANEGVFHYFSVIDQTTGELRYANAAGNTFRYTLGLFGYSVDVLTGSDSSTPQAASFATGALPATQAAYYQALVHTRNYAGFADFAYDLGRLTLFAGGRLSRERTYGDFDRDKSHEFVAATIANGGVLHVSAPAIAITDFSYRAGVQWHVSHEVMIYASASKAYKGPGLNFGPTLTAAQFAFNGAAVGKETARSYEIGARTQLLDRQLTLNLTAFYAPFTNFQVTTVLPTQPTSFATINAPEILSKGVELEFRLAPHGAPGFSLEGNLVYNDTRYKDFQNAPCYTGQAVATTPTTDPGICSARGGANVQSLNGFRTVGAPEWSWNVTAAYEHRFGAMRGFGQVHWFHTSAIQFGQNNNPQSVQPAYSTVDASLGFGPANRRWTVTGYVRNLFDQRFVSRISLANPTINQTVPFTALRSFGAALDVSF